MSAAGVPGGVERPADRSRARAATVLALAGALVLAFLPVHRAAGVSPSDEGVRLVPESTPRVGNCIPFGDNTLFGFSGFAYRNVPAFSMRPGTRFAFDLGGVNDVDVRRNIFFAPTHEDSELGPGVRPVEWTQVVSEEQVPENPRGNTVVGDYELGYSSESDFAFGGGGLAVGFGAAPPGTYQDRGCDKVVVNATRNDPSGYFYARFWNRTHLTLGALDRGWTSATSIAGMVVLPDVRTVRIDVLPGSDRNPVNLRSRGVLPVAVLSEADFDAPSEVVPTSLTFGATGEEPSLRRCGLGEDVDGDGLEDLVCHFDVEATEFVADTEEALLRGRAGADAIVGRDAVDVLAAGRR